MGQLIGAAEAAERLGVDVRSLYAYVSRGSLTRVGSDSRRRSQYDSDEIALLARRARPRSKARPGASIDVVVGSSVCTLADGRIRYRGRDVMELAALSVSFESVAHLLWTGDFKTSGSWTLPPRLRRVTAMGLKGFPADAPVLDRMAAALCASSGQLHAEATETDAINRLLVLTLAEAVPQQAGFDRAAAEPDASIARRLWMRLSPLRPTSNRVAALDCAMVLLADHELATSTLAVRIATSARAPLTGALLAGLGTLGGAAHAGAADAIHGALIEAKARRPQSLTSTDSRGFGQSVHRSGDPRTAPLLAAVRRVASASDRARIEGMLGDRVGSPPPNIDFALGALCFAARMPPGAASAIFALARSAGWIAHAAEELEEAPLRYRARAIPR